jgi:hypothetical protein
MVFQVGSLDDRIRGGQCDAGEVQFLPAGEPVEFLDPELHPLRRIRCRAEAVHDGRFELLESPLEIPRDRL